MAMRDQKDPSRVYNFVVFESERRLARASRIRGARRAASNEGDNGEIFDGAPEFVDLRRGGHVVLGRCRSTVSWPWQARMRVTSSCRVTEPATGVVCATSPCRSANESQIVHVGGPTRRLNL